MLNNAPELDGVSRCGDLHLERSAAVAVTGNCELLQAVIYIPTRNLVNANLCRTEMGIGRIGEVTRVETLHGEGMFEMMGFNQQQGDMDGSAQGLMKAVLNFVQVQK